MPWVLFMFSALTLGYLLYFAFYLLYSIELFLAILSLLPSALSNHILSYSPSSALILTLSLYCFGLSAVLFLLSLLLLRLVALL